MVEILKEKYGDDMRVVYRHLPLNSIHDKAQLAAEASEAAGAQGKFWEMHDILFQKQGGWSALSVEEATQTFTEYAESIGVPDMKQFTADLENNTYKEKVLASGEAAQKAGISSTPSFAVNGVGFPAQTFGLSENGLNIFIKLIQLRDGDFWFDGPEQVIDPAKQYIATIETEHGDIVIELYPDTAPVNVNSFAFLAEQGWYENSTFHRVLPEFVAQGGDPTGSGVGFPGYRCGDEVVASRTFDGPGTVSLANSGPDSNGGQFFITYTDTPSLNKNFTIIGQVIEGQDVVEKITPRDIQPDAPVPPPGDTIINIIVTEK